VALLSMPFLSSANQLKPLDFNGYEFSSNQKIQLSDYKGKIVYLDFWASWCPPCIKSMPFMETLHQKYPIDEFKIIAINIDENKSEANDFLKKHPISYLNLYDPEGDIGKTLKVKNMPTAFLIDRDGNILFKHSGFDQKYASKLEKVIGNLVEKHSEIN